MGMFRKKTVFNSEEIYKYVHLLNEGKSAERQKYDKGNLRVHVTVSNCEEGPLFTFYVYVRTSNPKIAAALEIVDWVCVRSDNKILVRGPWDSDIENLLKEIVSAGCCKEKEIQSAEYKAYQQLAKEYEEAK